MIPIAPDGILICIMNLLLGRNSVDKTSTGHQNPPKSNMCIYKKEDAFSSSDINFDRQRIWIIMNTNIHFQFDFEFQNAITNKRNKGWKISGKFSLGKEY